ncbi:MAG: TetR/AcrR family transcriptional regulator [Betaproteobacteria bacterium]
MPRPPRVSPDRILAAAAAEFAARGFAGARVDRIARRARVNKAMIYYHFKSKDALYRALLRHTFAAAAARLDAVVSVPGSPAEKMDRLIAAVAAFVDEHAFFPAIMLREVAEGGARLDPATLRALTALPSVVAGVVQEGTALGAFRPTHPLFAYLSLIVPMVVFRAAAPIQQRVTALHVGSLTPLAPDQFVRHMQEAARRSLASDAPSSRPSS